MIEIVKLTYHDDSNDSTSISVMACTSIEAAKEVILEAVNKGFEGDWKSLKDAADELNNELSGCSWNEESKVFYWYDNGKGETFFIGSVCITNLNREFNEFGEIC